MFVSGLNICQKQGEWFSVILLEELKVSSEDFCGGFLRKVSSRIALHGAYIQKEACAKGPLKPYRVSWMSIVAYLY